MILVSNDLEAPRLIEEDLFPEVPKSELLARELEYWLKCSNLPPDSYLRDLLMRSAETIRVS